MKSVLVAGIMLAGCALAGLAQAADLSAPSYAPAYAAPSFTWTGAYAGINAGYNWGHFSAGGRNLFGTANGGLVGVTAGYNYQMNQIVLGVEGDLGWDGARGARGFPLPAYARAKLNDVLTVRGRVGFAADRTLLFLTGGYAGGNTTAKIIDLSLPAGGQFFASSGWHSGYTLGTGIEYSFTDTISGKAEYLYTNLSSNGMFAAPHFVAAGVRENIVRGGVNYHF